MSTQVVTKKLNILLVEDSFYDRDAFRRAIQKGMSNFEISECVCAEDAVDFIVNQKNNFDLIVSDYNLMEMNGLDMYHVLREHGIETPFVILTGSGDEFLAVKALKEGVDDYLIKDPDQGYFKILPVVLPNVIERNNDKLRRKKAEEERNILLQDLKERVKELTCMYSLFESIGQRDKLDDIFQDTISFIPPGWQYPEITCARVKYLGNEYVTDNFKESKWKQASDIIVNDEISGSVEVFYLQEKPELDEGPFLKEERNLINGISRVLSSAIEKFIAEDKVFDLAKFPYENPNPIMRISKDGILITANPASQIFLTDWQRQVGMEVPDDWKKNVASAFDSGLEETVEIDFNGRTYSFLLIPIPQTTYVNIYGLDITVQKEAEKQRELVLRNLEEKNNQIERFISIIRHDFGNPIISIQGFSDELSKTALEIFNLVKDLDINDALKDKLISLLKDDISLSMDFIQKAVNQIKTLLDGLKYIASFGKIPIKKEAIDMDALLKDITSTMKYQFQEKDVQFQLDNLPPCFGDFEQIKRVFTNLLSNAVKYLAPDRSGRVCISGSTENGESIYCIKDNGIGISQENQDKVFDVFYREDNSNPESGEGLGLTIVAKILERHNGKIWLHSEPGVGSKFFVKLPKA